MVEEIISKLLNYLGDNYGLDYDDLGLTDEEIKYCKSIMEPMTEPTMFKVNDKVKFIGNSGGGCYPEKGSVGTVMHVDTENGIYCVEWGKASGVSFNMSEGRYAWWVSRNSIKLVED